ncbi:hypothetical protein V5O48_011116 [Marasmius crinis-equi]|uniref:Ricin B lectin domain-containing protein n=1 Tax=Marasmius crinis-equi TaxID=585013 RepID=A0ABR3F6G8_9AGAR
MRSALIALSALVSVASARLQLQSNAPAFDAAGRQGCISASDNLDGAAVVIHDCNTEATAKHDWELSLFTRQNAGPQPITIFNGTKCLDVKDGANADGSKLQIWSCVTGSTNQQWISVNDFTFQWSGTNKCIDLTNGDITDGNQLQVWTCDSANTNQKFTGVQVGNAVSRASELVGGPASADRPSLCMTAESNTDGALVSIAACDDIAATFPNGNKTWVFAQSPLSGAIKTFDGSKCLDVRGGSNANGNALQIWTCVEGSTNQQFTVDSPNTITWVGQNKCVDITNGNLTAGNHLQIWDCDASNANQHWFASSL